MTLSCKSRVIAALAMIAMFVASPQSLAQSARPILPPISYTKAMYLKNHPDAWKAFVAKLSHRPATVLTPRAAAQPAFTGGTWQAIATAPAINGLCNPLLLTDGTVIVSDCGSPDWYKLTPDITGSYSNGAWIRIASLPVIGGVQYAPLYHASAVLPDGRLIIMGGEYNNGVEALSNLGAIYDPHTNVWTPVPAPTSNSWSMIGDAESVVLANGTFMLASCCAYPDADALFNPSTLGWTTTGAPIAGEKYQDEQGYNLLPNDNVLTIDIWTKSPNGNATNAERYIAALRKWVSAGNTPVSLVDPYQCANWEIGPAVERPDGTLVAFGGNSGCLSNNALNADPTAIYNSSSGKWAPGPYVPAGCAGNYCTLADAPAAMLPDGNILFAAANGYGNPPTHFFEYTAANAIRRVADPLYNSDFNSGYMYNFLVLPNGQIFMTDLSDSAEVYTPARGPNPAWAPIITSAPPLVAGGGTYRLGGVQLNGLSQGADYGDDVQSATNYPIVQITNLATGHVFYAKTFAFSTMSIAPGIFGSANFTVPKNIETGPSRLVVIANGNPSSPQQILCVR